MIGLRSCVPRFESCWGRMPMTCRNRPDLRRLAVVTLRRVPSSPVGSGRLALLAIPSPGDQARGEGMRQSGTKRTPIEPHPQAPVARELSQRNGKHLSSRVLRAPRIEMALPWPAGTPRLRLRAHTAAQGRPTSLFSTCRCVVAASALPWMHNAKDTCHPLLAPWRPMCYP
jgi:hypothetical protein